MKIQEIRSYIDKLNRSKSTDTIFTRRIADSVEVAKVWNTARNNPQGYVGNFFFILNNEGEYVGAIYDMGWDLHWYIVPKHRGKGHLTKALRKAILPHIFHIGRDEQKISIELNAIGSKNYNSSKKVATSLGFTPIDGSDSDFILKATEFDNSHDQRSECNSSITNERLEEIKDKIDQAYELISNVRDELLMTYDEDIELTDLAHRARTYNYRIEDLMWKHRDLS